MMSHPQVWNAFLGLVPGLAVGMSMGFTAPALEYYSNKDTSPFQEGPITRDEGSWFGE